MENIGDSKGSKKVVVDAVSVDKLGIKDKEGNWYNYNTLSMGPEGVSSLQESFKVLSKGCVLQLFLRNDKIESFKVLEEAVKDDVVTYDVLLGRMNEKYPDWSMCVSELRVDWDKQAAYAVVRVSVGEGRFMEEVGDANQVNCGKFIAPHFVRMAVTRAKVRAFKNLLGESVVSEEEIR